MDGSSPARPCCLEGFEGEEEETLVHPRRAGFDVLNHNSDDLLEIHSIRGAHWGICI
jgi:hypothetical protein